MAEWKKIIALVFLIFIGGICLISTSVALAIRGGYRPGEFNAPSGPLKIKPGKLPSITKIKPHRPRLYC